MDDDQLKNGCAMILDPFGDIIAECTKLDNDIAIASIVPAKLKMSGGYRYRQARRPDLYKDIIGKENVPVQQVAWLINNGA